MIGSTMKMKLITPAVIVSGPIFCLSTTACAQLYGRINLGWSTSTGSEYREKNFADERLMCANPPTCTTGVKTDHLGNSAVLGMSAGWKFNDRFRAEVALYYRGGYPVGYSGPNSTTLSTDVKSWKLMLDGHYDFDLAIARPVVGAGLVLLRNKLETVHAMNQFGATDYQGGVKSGVACSLTAEVGV